MPSFLQARPFVVSSVKIPSTELRQLFQELPGALNRLADAELFLHVPDPSGDGMHHRHSNIFLRRHHVDNAPSAGAEKIDALSVRIFEKRSFEVMVDRFTRQVLGFCR